VEQVLPRGEGWHKWEEGGDGEIEVGRRIWCKKCVHIYVNAKMIPVKTIPGMKAWVNKEEWERG
jgi:hypothetical protein